jgi:hypothetical protein
MDSDIFRTPALLTDVALVALSPSEWRVTNRRIDDGDPSGLIGFIERTGDAYEVLRLGSPLDRSRFPTLEAARAAFVGGPASRANTSSRAA